MAWQKGKSGNPAGRGKDKVITQMLKSALNEAADVGDKTKMRAIIDAWIGAAMKGELSAIVAIADRVDGKPAQEAHLTVDSKPAAEMSDDELANIAAGSGIDTAAAPLDPSQLN